MGTRRRPPPVNKISCSASSTEIDGTLWITIRLLGGAVCARPGDLVVSYRLSKFQKVSNINGDPCTHVAMLEVINGQVVLIEMGEHGVFTRPLQEFAAAYEWITIVHLDCTESERLDLVAEASRRLAEAYMRYSLLQCTQIALFGLTRRFLPAVAEPWVIAVFMLWSRLACRRSGPDAATCSGFIAQCLDAALPRLRPPVFPSLPRTPPWKRAPEVAAVAARLDLRSHVHHRESVNALTSPSDLLVTVRSLHRTVITPTDVVVLPGVAVAPTANRPRREYLRVNRSRARAKNSASTVLTVGQTSPRM